MYPTRLWVYSRTLALDGDPLDVLVLLTEPAFPSCVCGDKNIGVFT
jgi:inorganic pyrophosphatase